MTTRFVKTAITVPGGDYHRVEQIRKRYRISRSEVFALALRSLFKSFERKDLEERYVQGYQKHPENTAELGAWIKKSLQSVEPETW
jgi:metal-responsive CopG/Arc/MetJ family transcriptional regulator